MHEAFYVFKDKMYRRCIYIARNIVLEQNNKWGMGWWDSSFYKCRYIMQNCPDYPLPLSKYHSLGTQDYKTKGILLTGNNVNTVFSKTSTNYYIQSYFVHLNKSLTKCVFLLLAT